ncbi:auxin-responsive protein SAUR71-like [Durio zibethinus]|uniref:Auxin-responsive protein SAUR71-like n=1 Tax=Durio zibethinus TaxID=66656 RepID=A0A6P5WH17_DURZI|nr:auxin-responsive protein SAUR71-like [Durio zibethinus]XP_022715405.1 auxin-responsive protein SAUR71-like [Durio zibethinus]
MKKLMRRLSRVTVTHSTQYSMLRSEQPDPPVEPTKQRSDVPHGHFPVYVGIDQTSMRRFIVSAEMLRNPIFVELLNRSAQEYGYEQRGVLRIPINVVVFERVLESLRQGQEPSNLD